MSTVTPKLGLIKPASGERFSRADYSANLDKIDAGVLAAGLTPYNWVQKISQFGNPWNGTNDYVNRAPLWGTNTWSNNIGLTSGDIDFNAANPDTFIIKKKGLWVTSFRLSGTTTAASQRIQAGVAVNTFSGGTADTPPNNWENSANGTTADTADLGLGVVNFGCFMRHYIFKASNTDITYKPGFFCFRQNTLPVGVLTGVIGFTYLGPFA